MLSNDGEYLNLLIALLANPIVIILFGSNWLEAVPLIQILAFVYILRSIGNPAGSLLLSRGKANIAFYWNLITFLLRPISIIIGSYFGIIGITFSILMIQIILFLPNWKFIVNKFVGINLKEFLFTIFNPLLLSVISIAAISIPLFFIENSLLKILVGFFVFSLIYALLIYKYEFKLFKDIISFLPTSITNKIRHSIYKTNR